jgi:hypothetical protein
MFLSVFTSNTTCTHTDNRRSVEPLQFVVLYSNREEKYPKNAESKDTKSNVQFIMWQ